MIRQPRDRRRRGSSARLTERDQALLLAINRFRLAKTSDLLAFAFADIRRDTALRRLRCLFDAGYVDVIAGDRSQENTYHLGAAGRRWLALQDRDCGGAPRGGHAHHLAVVRVWSTLVSVVGETPKIELELFRPDWEIREHCGLAVPELIPDALVQVLFGTLVVPIRLRFVIEVDLGTERPPVIRRKLRSYRELAVNDGLFGWRDFGVIMYVPGTSLARQQRIAGLLTDEWRGWFNIWPGTEDIRRFLLQVTSRNGTGRRAT